MHKIGGECVFASEIDEDARITYERNFEISPDLFKRTFENKLFNKDKDQFLLMKYQILMFYVQVFLVSHLVRLG